MVNSERKHLKRKPLSKKQRIIIYTVSVILVSFLLSLVLMFMVNDAFALTATSGSTVVSFTEDVGLFKASKTLKEKEIIDSRVWFTLYAKVRGRNMTVKAGSYEISYTGGFDGILSVLGKDEKNRA